jgi:nucleoside-diphosphate-sugar epimerase
MASSREALLIGGDGFLGGHATAALQAAGWNVTVLSRGNHAAPAGTRALRADRRDRRALASALGGRSFDFTGDLAAYDAAGVEALWGVPDLRLGRYALISSGQVYLVTDRPRPPFREAQSRRALSPEPAAVTRDHGEWRYGVGKREAEAVVRALRRHHGARAVVLRLPVLQGEGDPSLRLWAWLERMLDGGPLLLPDSGRRPTRFLDVRDAAAALVRLAEGAWPARGVYNLAAPSITSLRRFLGLAASAAGLAPSFVSIPRVSAAAHGLDPGAWPYSGHWSSLLDPSRAARDLGFRGTPPEEYLPRVVRWHLEHRPASSHAGYAQRALERRLAERHLTSRAKTLKRGAGTTDDERARGRPSA